MVLGGVPLAMMLSLIFPRRHWPLVLAALFSAWAVLGWHLKRKPYV